MKSFGVHQRIRTSYANRAIRVSPVKGIMDRFIPFGQTSHLSLSNQQNRDRLELYALHKQAVSSDAPATFNATGAEKAKYQAWRSKSGMSPSEAMRAYIQESDRQVRVYGSKTISNGSNPQTPQATPAYPQIEPQTPRGLAAIALLSAAAAETRQAYLQRLSQTPKEAAWWARQEALCANPGSLGALPETFVLELAKFVEHLSLDTSRVFAAALWPLHNLCLCLWMGVILVVTLMTSAGQSLQILLWGGRRTGMSLNHVWTYVTATTWVQCVHGMCESQQAIACRLVGLCLLPGSTAVVWIQKLLGGSTALAASAFLVLLVTTWWYWLLVLPCAAVWMFWASVASGACFAMIEFAGV